MKRIRCYDNSDGIRTAKAGNLGVAYFGGQTYVFLTKSMYAEKIGKENFEKTAIEVFGRDVLLRFSRGREELIKPGYFSEEQVFQIELPSLIVYPSNPGKKVKIDPEKKINGLVKIINEMIVAKK